MNIYEMEELAHLNDDPQLQQQMQAELLIRWVNSFEGYSHCSQAFDLTDFRNGIIFCELVFEIILQKQNSTFLSRVVTSDLTEQRCLSNIALALLEIGDPNMRLSAYDVYAQPESQIQLLVYLRKVHNSEIPLAHTKSSAVNTMNPIPASTTTPSHHQLRQQFSQHQNSFSNSSQNKKPPLPLRSKDPNSSSNNSSFVGLEIDSAEKDVDFNREQAAGISRENGSDRKENPSNISMSILEENIKRMSQSLGGQFRKHLLEKDQQESQSFTEIEQEHKQQHTIQTTGEFPLPIDSKNEQEMQSFKANNASANPLSYLPTTKVVPASRLYFDTTHQSDDSRKHSPYQDHQQQHSYYPVATNASLNNNTNPTIITPTNYNLTYNNNNNSNNIYQDPFNSSLRYPRRIADSPGSSSMNGGTTQGQQNNRSISNGSTNNNNNNNNNNNKMPQQERPGPCRYQRFAPMSLREMMASSNERDSSTKKSQQHLIKRGGNSSNQQPIYQQIKHILSNSFPDSSSPSDSANKASEKQQQYLYDQQLSKPYYPQEEFKAVQYNFRSFNNNQNTPSDSNGNNGVSSTNRIQTSKRKEQTPTLTSALTPSSQDSRRVDLKKILAGSSSNNQSSKRDRSFSKEEKSMRKKTPVQIEEITEETKQRILDWLHEIKLLKKLPELEKQLFKVCGTNGVLFADIVNLLEGKSGSLIKGIERNPSHPSHATANYNKIIAHLSKFDKMNPRFLTPDHAMAHNQTAFWAFLDDLYYFARCKISPNDARYNQKPTGDRDSSSSNNKQSHARKTSSSLHTDQNNNNNSFDAAYMRIIHDNHDASRKLRSSAAKEKENYPKNNNNNIQIQHQNSIGEHSDNGQQIQKNNQVPAATSQRSQLSYDNKKRSTSNLLSERAPSFNNNNNEHLNGSTVNYDRLQTISEAEKEMPSISSSMSNRNPSSQRVGGTARTATAAIVAIPEFPAETLENVKVWLRSLGFTYMLTRSEKQVEALQILFKNARASERLVIRGSTTTSERTKLRKDVEKLVVEDPIKNGVLACLVMSRIEMSRASGMHRYPTNLEECRANFDIVYRNIRSRAISAAVGALWKQEDIFAGDLTSFWILITGLMQYNLNATTTSNSESDLQILLQQQQQHQQQPPVLQQQSPVVTHNTHSNSFQSRKLSTILPYSASDKERLKENILCWVDMHLGIFDELNIAVSQRDDFERFLFLCREGAALCLIVQAALRIRIVGVNRKCCTREAIMQNHKRFIDCLRAHRIQPTSVFFEMKVEEIADSDNTELILYILQQLMRFTHGIPHQETVSSSNGTPLLLHPANPIQSTPFLIRIPRGQGEPLQSKNQKTNMLLTEIDEGELTRNGTESSQPPENGLYLPSKYFDIAAPFSTADVILQVKQQSSEFNRNNIGLQCATATGTSELSFADAAKPTTPAVRLSTQNDHNDDIDHQQKIDSEWVSLKSWLNEIGLKKLSDNIDVSTASRIPCFENGTGLCELLEKLEGKEIPGKQLAPKTQAHCRFNLTKCMELLETKHGFNQKLLWDTDEFYACSNGFVKRLLLAIRITYKKNSASLKRARCTSSFSAARNPNS